VLCDKSCDAVSVRRIAPNFENCTLQELKVAEKNAASKRAARRIMAIRLFYGGYDRAEVQRIVDCDAKSLVTWIKRFNDYGIDGLMHDVERPGRPTKIPPSKHEAFKELLRNPHQEERDFWTARAVHGFLSKQWDIQLAYSTTCQAMHEANFAIKSPRPWPGLRQDPEKRALYLKDLEKLKQDPAVELWYGDETGIEGDPKPRRRWKLVKQTWFNNHHCNTHELLAARVDLAFKSLFEIPTIVRSACGGT
jgi:transposase